MPDPTIVFDSEDTARTLVAGLPCAVRALLRLAECGALKEARLVAPGPWQKSAPFEAEIGRLLPDTKVAYISLDDCSEALGYDALELLSSEAAPTPRPVAEINHTDPRPALKQASRAIVAGTGKEADGPVSRRLNRPISQFLSYHLLKLPWFRPMHATFATALCGLAMTVCLFLGGQSGLIAGGLLLQITSVVDGVDGEVARATQRGSKLGAALDSATDTITSLAFWIGLIFIQWQAGNFLTAYLGIAAMVMLVVGLIPLAIASLRETGAMGFATLKSDPRVESTPLLAFFRALFTRDVVALVMCILAVIGAIGFALALGALAAAIWLVSCMILLATDPKSEAE